MRHSDGLLWNENASRLRASCLRAAADRLKRAVFVFLLHRTSLGAYELRSKNEKMLLSIITFSDIRNPESSVHINMEH